ncbi:MAG TPA: CcoQ/FixQ family Cbb3-type cytochrome c oxidase assembly chaperone [Mariprofundaceae bacterium]|nr:CcoQ/FixQ family Cbb3-type cytochrome c oxidase assembly chaperone [Mariprofundaceae bacterium]
MSKLEEYFLTDWEAMTRTDWAGLIIVLLLAALMIGLYAWVFRPKNRDRFEQYRDFVNKDDDMEREVKHGGQ